MAAPYRPVAGSYWKQYKHGLIQGRADRAARGLAEGQAQAVGGVLDAVEVARDPADGREDEHTPLGWGELLRLLVPRVTEADGLRQPVDGRGSAREEVPALGGARAAIALEKGVLLRAGAAGVSRASKLTVTISNSFPASKERLESAPARPLSDTVHNMGQSK
jgi:hypothetical protein